MYAFEYEPNRDARLAEYGTYEPTQQELSDLSTCLASYIIRCGQIESHTPRYDGDHSEVLTIADAELLPQHAETVFGDGSRADISYVSKMRKGLGYFPVRRIQTNEFIVRSSIFGQAEGWSADTMYILTEENTQSFTNYSLRKVVAGLCSTDDSFRFIGNFSGGPISDDLYEHLHAELNELDWRDYERLVHLQSVIGHQ